MEVVDIPLGRMALLYLFLLLPLLLMWRLRVSLLKRLLISAARMSLQLVLVGIYLGYLFQWNNPLLNLLWLAVMISVAAGHILHSAQLRRRELYGSVLISITIALVTILAPFLLGILQPEPLLDARYLIPFGGMMLGNFLSSNIVALHHFSQALKQGRQELQTAFCFGATRFEAIRPFLREAFIRALTPMVTHMSTIGLVSLPGMMTGQLLGGSFPLVAIKYQIAIMIAIISAGSLSIVLTLLILTRRLFDERDNLAEALYL